MLIFRLSAAAKKAKKGATPALTTTSMNRALSVVSKLRGKLDFLRNSRRFLVTSHSEKVFVVDQNQQEPKHRKANPIEIHRNKKVNENVLK